MKKSDLLAKIAVLLAATDKIPDDADITLISINYFGVEIYTPFAPAEAITTDAKGDYIVSDAHGIKFVRQK